ncbi:MAG: helix-turn-helix transcriptional regulator [Collinsella sp.]|nr:helix-turn-helix transcriptional regulator [Collinsella sp.]
MNLKLKQARKENGYSQADLADALNVDIKTVGNWERGKTLPDIEQLWKCAKILHTDPNDLLGWYEEHPEDKPTAPAGAEGELLYCYRQSTEKRRSKILETARDQAELSQAQAAEAEIEGLEEDQVRTA